MSSRFSQALASGLMLIFLASVGGDSDCGQCITDDGTNSNFPQSMFEALDDGGSHYSSEQTQAQPQNPPASGDAAQNCQEDQPQPINCDPDSRYRTYDGSCNNLNNPSWGMKGDCLQRFLPAAYEGSSGIRNSAVGGSLPAPRNISNNLLQEKETPNSKTAFLFLIYGQFVSHEISYSNPQIGDISDPYCCPPSDDDRCIPILIRNNDPYYSKYNRTCISVTRTPPCKCGTSGKRQHANKVTAAIDGSNIYGTSKDEADKLRRKDGTGQMKVEKGEKNPLLPGKENPYSASCPKAQSRYFEAGDERVNQHTALMSQHTLFVREHNRVAKKLKILNPSWDEETLFQETRRIVVAVFQVITCKDFLPTLLGPGSMQENNLSISEGGRGTSYDPSARLGAWEEFSTAGMRLHTMVSHHTGTPTVSFEDWYHNPEPIRKGQMTEMLTGLWLVPSQQYGVHMVDDIRDNLIKPPCADSGLDIGSVNVQRGRDHGLPTYVDMVRYCSGGSVDIKTFDQLSQLMPKKAVIAIRNTYNDVNDIDLWIGINKEKRRKGAQVGPTAACIIGKQFYIIKYGDRFFFEHEGEAPSFTPDQREALKKSSYSRLICDNTDTLLLQKNALLLPGVKNPFVPCATIPKVDLSAWKDTNKN